MENPRPAQISDLKELLLLESISFTTDRLNKRSFRRWLTNRDCVFLVQPNGSQIIGYILIILMRGTKLARLYSIAVHPDFQHRGVGTELIQKGEKAAREDNKLYMRLEVAQHNDVAIRLFTAFGYVPFGLYKDYYEDHQDALRMERCIHRFEPTGDSRIIPWLAQTTPFTCGPACLMMAMAELEVGYVPTPRDEIQIWRDATTIFMTSGHGGCHPMGLALAAVARGFSAEVWLNLQGTLFIDGVRDANKKRVIAMVHGQFMEQIESAQIPVVYEEINQQDLVEAYSEGANVLILISTYRLDRKKVPHWVVLSGYDDDCLYVHDPDLDDEEKSKKKGKNKTAIDCQHLPIARDSFAAMSQYGGNRLRCAVIIRPIE